MKTPIKVAVTGAAGHIGYALVFRIASGQMFGLDQPLSLHLIEIPVALGSLEGVVMELDDCAFPLLESVVPTPDLVEGFRDINWALLVGSVLRKGGMERKELLGVNGKPAVEVSRDGNWLKRDFIAAVQQRCAAIINARGLSSAASAANAVVDTVNSLTNDTPANDWHSVAICSDGSYDVEEGLISS